MKLNWRVRFRNKVWLSAFIGLVVAFVYNLLAAFDVFPAVTESTVMEIARNVLTFLGLIGVVVDPTTDGIEDSNRAMGYSVPWKDTEVKEEE